MLKVENMSRVELKKKRRGAKDSKQKKRKPGRATGMAL